MVDTIIDKHRCRDDRKKRINVFAIRDWINRFGSFAGCHSAAFADVISFARPGKAGSDWLAM